MKIEEVWTLSALLLCTLFIGAKSTEVRLMMCFLLTDTSTAAGVEDGSHTRMCHLMQQYHRFSLSAASLVR
jgi:hypothetical protein